MLPGDDVVGELTRLVWNTVLGLDASDHEGDGEDGEITTAVDITGAWEGTVSITFTRSLAKHLAAAMLLCGENEASPADIRDVVAELTNMVGGNVKGLLPGPTQLSLPRVQESTLPARPRNASRRWFDCDGHPFSVTVTEKSGGTGPESSEGRQT